jgi:short-subunit dehydrogenase
VICPGFVRSRITDKNTCPMPFFMEAEPAAKIIVKGVLKNSPIIAFPLPMRLAAWVVSILPERLGELIFRALPKKST